MIFKVEDLSDKSSKNNTHKLLEIDFTNSIITLSFKDHEYTEYSFKQIKNVVQHSNHDDFVIEFDSSEKKNLRTVYQAQRDLIVKILIYASEFFTHPYEK